jgi:hypothetical protein
VTFTDITEAAGIKFVHNNGAAGDKLMPETMGSGVAFFDFDNDGDPDLLFSNGTAWPEQLAEGTTPTTVALYRNDGDGRFSDVTDGSGLATPMQGMGVAIGDIDNDGLADVYLTAVGENRLFRNLGDGTFSDITATANVAGDAKDWSTSAAFIDVNNDGLLDLFVCNYIRWTREIDFEVNYTLVGVGRAYGPPMNFEGAFPSLYLNRGEGVFEDVSESSGVQVKNRATGVPVAKSLGVAPVDFNRDGAIDLIVANDTVPNFVFRNNGDGTFQETGALTGVAFDSYGNARGAMGIDAAEFMEDGSLGIAIGNFTNEMSALFVAAPDSPIFTDEAIAQGIGPSSRKALTFGTFFFDYDLDGWLDLLAVNGHLEEEIGKVQESQSYEQSAQLFWNATASPRGGGFVPVDSGHAGNDLFEPIVGRGSAYADIDGDGDLDAVFTSCGGAPKLLRNDLSVGDRWVRVRVVETEGKRDAIGAIVRLTTNAGRTLVRRISPTRSYLSQSEAVATFGLGEGETVKTIEAAWPGGRTQEVGAIALGSVKVFE